MKSFIFLIAMTICYCAQAQERKQLFLSCDVLGNVKGENRYYHPINGEYSIDLKNYYLPTKKDQKDLSNFVLINPASYLTDSVTHVQANSLRTKIKLNELIYVNWGFGYDTLNNQAKLDSFKNNACYRRDDHYAEVVEHYFSPFMISKYEITNAEYREFVDWVKDSIFREKIYVNTDPTGNDEIEEEVIAEMLIHPDVYFDEEEGEWVDFDPSDHEKNRALFHFDYDFDWRKEIKGNQYIPLISDMYLRPNERWYKRREYDVSKLVYRFETVDYQRAAMRHTEDLPIAPGSLLIENTVSVYPDTTSWLDIDWITLINPMINMYFWHPAYDNFPVVGLSFVQVQAYIHWKEQQLEKEFPELMEYYQLSLPNTQEVEWAINSNVSGIASTVVADNEIITDLIFGVKGETNSKYESLIKQNLIRLTEMVSRPFTPQNIKEYSKGMKKISDEFFSSEEQRQYFEELLMMRYSENKLANGIEFLSNNVSEWMDDDYLPYKKVLNAYINYNCFSDINYCQFQRPIDQAKIAKNDEEGQLIMGSNWYDERYENTFGVNTGGIYPKRFSDQDSSYATVGFRLVLRAR